MRKKLNKIVSLGLLLVMLVSTLLMTSCAKKPTEEEARALVLELYQASLELNEIYFGEGLAYEDDGDEEVLYSPVSEDAPYQTESALKDATYLVFSKEYADSIISLAFEGIAGASGGAIYPRYITFSGGRLCVYENIEGIELTEYDLSELEIVKISKRFIESRVQIGEENGESIYLELVLVRQDDGWRLDSASY